jgi:uncharacterized membrane protein (DUF373 family)
MKWDLTTNRFLSNFEFITIAAMQVLLIFAVATATIVLFLLFARNLIEEASKVETVADLLPAMQQSFAGILIVVLGLELLETLKTYFTERHVRIEVILVVAIIAIGRHVIKTDFEHTPGIVLLGLAALILALVLGYFLIKKSQFTSKAGQNGSGPSVID